MGLSIENIQQPPASASTVEPRDVMKFLLLFLFAGLLGFAGAYSYDQQRLLRMMSVAFDGAKIKSISFTNMVIEIYLKVTNLSRVDINVEEYDLAVYVNDKPIIPHITAPEQGYIKAQGESIVPLSLQFNPMQVLANLFSGNVMNALLSDYSKVFIRVVGKISANHAGVEIKDINVDITENLQSLLYKDANQPKSA